MVRYREPATHLDQLVERLHPAEIIVAIRERVTFSRTLIERLPKLRLIALVGRAATTIDYQACREHGVLVTTGASNSPTSPAELTVALIVASRRHSRWRRNGCAAGLALHPVASAERQHA